MVTIENLKIEDNTVNGGICALFNAGDQQYYADITHLTFVGNECMIFKAENDQVTSWSELYCNRDVDVSEESLKKCIEEFVSSLN